MLLYVVGIKIYDITLHYYYQPLAVFDICIGIQLHMYTQPIHQPFHSYLYILYSW